MNIKISLIVVSMILLVGTISALDAHLFANSTDDVLLNLSNDGHAYLTESFHGGVVTFHPQHIHGLLI